MGWLESEYIFLLYMAEAAPYLKIGYSFQGIVEYTTERMENLE